MKLSALLASTVAVIGCLSAPSLGANNSLHLSNIADYGLTISYMGHYGPVSAFVPVGPITINVDGAHNAQKMLCVDLHSTVNRGNTWIANLTSDVPQQTTSALWDKVVYIAMTNNGWANGTFTAEQSAAVQLAIWEIIEDNGNFNLNSGNFQLRQNNGGWFDWNCSDNNSGNSNIAKLAKSYYDAANPTAGFAQNYKWYNAIRGATCFDGYQDMIYYQNSMPTTSVPEVPTALPISLGLTLLGAFKGRLFLKRK